jgi:hypothetical protein
MDAKEHFLKSAAQHTVMSKAHGVLAEECDKAEDSAKAEAHRTLEKAHAERAKHYQEMHSDAANKAAIDELAKSRAALEPQRVSGVVPDNPTLRAVPRFGAKPFATAVDEEFEFLVSSGDDRA